MKRINKSELQRELWERGQEDWVDVAVGSEKEKLPEQETNIDLDEE